MVLGGTNGNDILIGSIGDDTIWGDNGNDRIEGGHGNDVIEAGAGHDIISMSVGEPDFTAPDIVADAGDARQEEIDGRVAGRLLMLAEEIDGDTAVRIGLADQVVAQMLKMQEASQ